MQEIRFRKVIVPVKKQKKLKSSEKKTKELKKNLLLLFIVIFLFFLFFEIFLRIFAPQPILKYTFTNAASTFYNESDYLPWQIKPSIETNHFNEFGEFNVSIKHNSLGYRDKEFSINKSQNITRILVLGDSHTHGFGVELNETYHKVFEKKINERINKYEIINAGYKSGDSPNTQYLYLKKEGILLNPDIVLIGFSIVNDFEDHKYNFNYFDENGELERIVSTKYYVDEKNRLRTYSIKKDFIREELYKINLFLSFRLHTYILFKNSFRNSLMNFYKGKRDGGIYANNYSSETKKEVEEVLNYLLKIKNISQENNAKLIIIIIPRREEVYESKIKDKEGNFLNWSKPYDLLTNFAESNEIALINLLPKFKEYVSDNNTLLYFVTDLHLNKNGHYVAGQLIYEKFQEGKQNIY